MTYNAAIPLSGDSPGIFPAQSQTNFARLQTLVGADHQFNLTAAANDGYHNLVHLTQQAPAGALAAIGRLYVKSVDGLIQLHYMNDAGTEYQVTPAYYTSTQKVAGSASLASGASTNALNVAYDYTGFGVVYINGTNVQRTYNFMRSGSAVDIHELDDNQGAVFRPTLQFVGTVLTAKNNDGSSQTVIWSLMVNRL
jgi:hypothetical protein